jgi:putative addiction module component (TIGR02574 family)
MSKDAEELYAAALKLSEKERSDLAARLIESLDEPFDDEVEVEKAWQEEVERRVDAMDAGIGKSVPWPEARRRILGLKDDTAAA